ncbi:uncharacterized protein L199_000186 [Kwoniella botswanensis]|uniref:uncharacterized protein n=1 Tax=Kwoniella botswanensis TaxID=1268659 RepID=UPI00315D502A
MSMQEEYTIPSPQRSSTTSELTKIEMSNISGEKENVATRLSHCVVSLSPAFFSLNMGTGIVSILFYTFPYPARWLRAIGLGIFVLNVVLFLLLSVGNVIRYIRWKGLFKSTLKHSAAALPWGTLPMGFVTLVTHTIESMSASWLLPIVSLVVAAASGGVVAEAVSQSMPSTAKSIVITSYIVWGTGVPLALSISATYLYRLIAHGAPAPQALPSLFLLVGPCGQGSFGIITLGKVVRDLAHTSSFDILATQKEQSAMTIMADAMYAGGLVTGLILWGLGLCWYLLATAIFIDHLCNVDRSYLRHRSFNISFTALTFPIGVWASASNALATELDSEVFRVIGAVVSTQVFVNWLYVMTVTIYKAFDGSIFIAPESELFTSKHRQSLQNRSQDIV